MYPGTIFQWHNLSQIQSPEPAAVDNSPLFLHLSSFDKGPEDLREVRGEEFYSLYGTKMRFANHGQPSIQAANIINSGGRLLLKRLVAKDAKLANLIGVATVRTDIKAVKAVEGDPNATTLEEILTGSVTEKVYAEPLTFTSKAGTKIGHTKLTGIDTKLEEGMAYYYKETDSDLLPELGTVISEDNGYTKWDGKEISVEDGTKLAMALYSEEAGITKYGVVIAVSKLAPQVTVSENPTNALPALYMTSTASKTDGKTILTVTRHENEVNSETVEYKLYYKTVDESDILDEDGDSIFPDAIQTEANSVKEGAEKGWKYWDGTSEIEVDDGANLMFVDVEVTYTEPDSTVDHYVVKAGCSIIVTSKLPVDERVESSVAVAPTDDLYVVLETSNSVKWSALSVENCLNKEEVMEEASKLFVTDDPIVETTDTGVTVTFATDYPLITVTDNGRCDSNKALKIVPDMTTSKDMIYMMYNASIFEGTTEVDAALCSLDPTAVVGKKMYGLNNETMTQVIFGQIPGVWEAYVAHISDLTGYTVEELVKYDLMFMTTNRGKSMTGISYDVESVDFGSDYGVKLANGDNGEFGDAPFGTDAWTEAACAVIDDAVELWDPDTCKIYGIFDANYPEPVKDKLAWFSTKREDTMFFRDYGLDVFSYASIVNKCESISEEYKNYFNAEYFTTYQIYDPETRVRERVTMMYDFAAVMVDHFARGAYRPTAGIVNGMILESAIPDTINFTPYKMPNVNQKALIDDMRVNYAIFHEGQCVVQSVYTADFELSQCSYLNNILAVEEVIRAVRIACPKQRFRFVTNNDFSVYAEAVNNVLKGFRSNFASLQFEYTQDRLRASQKIFDAGLYFRFNNWEQTEYFNIYCLGDEQ